MVAEPFFRRDGDTFLPNPICRGPWGPTSLHGRVVAGLLAHEIETKWLEPGFHPARLTVDLYRMPRFTPVLLSSRVARDGNRIRIVDAEFSSEGVSFGRASCVLLRKSANPPGEVWSAPPWQVPPPDALPAPVPDPERPSEPMWDSRGIGGGFGTVEQKRTWLRETRELIGNVALTPFVRAAIACDFSSPWANSGSEGLQFVNADITLYLHRLPEGEWLGFEVAAHNADEGICVGECVMYDTSGPIGRSTVTGLAQNRRAI